MCEEKRLRFERCENNRSQLKICVAEEKVRWRMMFSNVAVHISICGSSVIIVMCTARIGPKVCSETERWHFSIHAHPPAKFMETSRPA